MTLPRFRTELLEGAADLRDLVAFARQATAARAPSAPYRRPGDVVWGMRPPNDPQRNVRLWRDAAGLAAYIWVEPPDYVQFEVRTDLGGDSALLSELFNCGEQCCRPAGGGTAATISTTVLASDLARISAAKANGYGRMEQRYGLFYRRSLDVPIPENDLPAGFRVRYATETDIAERVACHRDAWSVWGPSSFNEATQRWLRRAPEFDQTLDLVVEAPEGTFASCCLVWADPSNAAGHFEPVGTRPAFTGRGLAREMLFEGMRRLRRRGIETAYVSTAGHNERARVLYESVGFERFETELWYEKQLPA